MKKVRKTFTKCFPSLCVLFIGCGFATAGMSDENVLNGQEVERERKTGVLEKGSRISVQDNRLSVELVDAQFGTVIDSVAKQSGFSVVINSNVKQKKVSTKFQNIDLERGIIRLLKLVREKNYLIHYDKKGMVSKLEIYSGEAVSSVAARPAVSSRPPAQRPSRVSPASRRRPTRSPAAVKPRVPRRRVTRPRPRVQPPQTENINEAMENRNREGVRGDLEEEPVGVVPYVPPKQQPAFVPAVK